MISQEQIVKELTSIYEYLQKSYNEKDGEILTRRITNLNASLARSAELLADTKYYLDKKKGEVSEELIEKYPDLSATQLKSLLESKVALEQRLYSQCERLNRSITHQLEGLRTQLSYLKSLPS